METCDMFCSTTSSIHWIWFVVATLVAYGAGAIWYSFLFSKTWMRVFKVEMPEKPNTSNTVITMLMQLLVTALLGLVFFVLTKISPWLSWFVLIAFCGWQKGILKFQFADWKIYFQAAIVEVGYTFLVGVIFILFALI